ncbi:hypothetical protein HYFRA_00008213 [Hymenoscyphus fraxineus]|uniref:2EXR domain-containing protein n=1 Tax=Hymenoscyphus fraxineus TaxID=746836 RepID=A0A9N9L6R6_9HELO|nr:hypothetical protein HYFRA_00008213 [Hymenoscyphus fraxineus]
MEIYIGVSQTQSPLEFHCFINLPPELRRKIWILTLPAARKVELSYKPLSERCYWGQKTGFTSTTPVPVTLHVCREAREVAKEMGFELSFGALFTEPKVWFRTGVDILWFSSGDGSRVMRSGADERETRGSKEGLEGCQRFIQVVTLVDPVSLGKVRHLAVEEGFFGSYMHDFSSSAARTQGCGVLDEDWRMLQFWESIKRKFAGLEEVTFYLGSGEGGKKDGGGRRSSFPGLFLPVEWLREREWKERVRRLQERLENAVGFVGRQGVGGNGFVKWTAPRWRIEGEGTEWGAG